MKVPWKKATTRLGDPRDGEIKTLSVAQQIAELRVELKRCKRENAEMEVRHNQAVRDLNSGYSDAIERVYSVDDGDATIIDLEAELERCKLQAELVNVSGRELKESDATTRWSEI